MPKKMKNTQEQDYVTNKILAVFSLCLFGVMGLWYVNSLLRSNNFLIGLRIFSVMRWIGLALVIGSAAVMMMDQKNGRSSKRLFAGRNLLVASVLFTLLAFLLDRDPVRMIKLCYGLLPALAIYYLIYHSYQPEFFTVATDVGIGAAWWAMQLLGLEFCWRVRGCLVRGASWQAESSRRGLDRIRIR